MTTSGTTSYSMNVRQVVTYALRKIRILSATETPTAEDASLVMENLNVMLKSWQMMGPNLFRQTQGSLTLTANTASFTLSGAYRVISARFKQNGREIPMEPMTREEYFDMPLKTSTGIPTTYYFDPQRGGGTLYIWPLLAAVDTETIEYTYQRRFEDVTTLDETIDIPQDWLETVGINVAARVMPDFGKSDRDIFDMAAVLLRTAKSADVEPVVRFEPA